MDKIIYSKQFKKILNNVISRNNKMFSASCLGLSALLFEEFSETYRNANIFKVKAGNLYYKTKFSLYKYSSGYDLSKMPDKIGIFIWKYPIEDIYQENYDMLDGHVWIEIFDKYIIDISILRTINSDMFEKSYKLDITNYFNKKQYIILNKNNNDTPLFYEEKQTIDNSFLRKIIEEYQIYLNK